MKKAVSILLVLVLVFGLSACGKSDIIGTWECRLDMRDELVETIDGIFAAYDVMLSDGRQMPRLADYVEDFSLKYTMVFNEDGTYSAGIDSADRQSTMEALKASATEYYNDFFFILLAETVVQMGVDWEINSPEDLEAFMGVTLDEAIEEILGMNMDSYLDVVMSGMMDGYMTEDIFQAQGRYKTKDGHLHLSDGLDGEIFDEVYDPYTVEGNTLTISAGPAGLSSEIKEFYPLVLDKVA